MCWEALAYEVYERDLERRMQQMIAERIAVINRPAPQENVPAKHQVVAKIGIITYIASVAHFQWKDATGLRPQRGPNA